jgi:hypothetical protein
MAKYKRNPKSLELVNRIIEQYQLGWAFIGPVSTSIVMMHGGYWGYSTRLHKYRGIVFSWIIVFLNCIQNIKVNRRIKRKMGQNPLRSQIFCF